MTKRKNMTAGERQQSVEKRTEQLEFAIRMSQMLLQQIGNSVQGMQRDISELASMQRDLQYRTVALQSLSGSSLDEVNALAEQLQIKDFNEASDKEDEELDYSAADVISENSIIVITSKADQGRDILRSKLVLSEIAFPKLREDLLGKKANDVIEADLNGTHHTVTVLSIRNKPAEETVDEQNGSAVSPQVAGDATDVLSVGGSEA
jgi:hypothetical protein